MKKIFVVFLLAISYACDKEPVDIDKELPKIEVLLPERNSVYKRGDKVSIRVSFKDNNYLREGAIHIHDKYLPLGKDTVFTYRFPIDARTSEIDTSFVPDKEWDTDYVIYFQATDRAENFTEKLRYFYLRN